MLLAFYEIEPMPPSTEPTDEEICAYLDENLVPGRAADVERLLRERPDLRSRAALLARRRDQGGHSVGEIWRRRRLSCPSRKELGDHLLGIAAPEREEYLQFHLSLIGCRFCQANLEDLKSANSVEESQRRTRHQRYFESSAGILRSQRAQNESRCE